MDERFEDEGATEDVVRPRGRHFATPPVSAAEEQPAAPRPDETAVFLAAAARRAPRTQAGHRAAPDETAMFIAAAQGRAVPVPDPAHPARPRAAVSPEPVVDAGAGRFPDMHAASAADAASTGDLTASASSAGATASPAAAQPAAPADDDFEGSGDYESVGRSAGLMTALIIVSRLTGFVRTWFMGVAFGVSLLASSYNIANNLPNMLYELVMGGMLVTAFLPVYMDARRNGGREGANDYVSNLLSILLVVLGVVSVVACVAAPFLIWTQSFMSSGSEMDLAVYFFRFFAFQILFYGLGSIFSGVLNAHRDYFWSNFGPILNNVVVIASFASYPVLAELNPQLAVMILAVGTTAGVFVQMACQIPALRKYGIRPRFRINLRDPLLKKTVSLGVPTVVATVCTLVTASVSNSAALAVQPGTGASVMAYAKLWYTLPYALLAVSLNTALYTELARDATNGDDDAVREGISGGIAQQFFVLIPFSFYLMVFSLPLNLVYCSGNFDYEGVGLVAEFLRFYAVALPFYGVCMLMQKGCSALRDMRPYAAMMVAGAIAEIAVAMGLGVYAGGGMPLIALSVAASYLVSDIGAFVWMRRRLHGLRLKKIFHGVFWGLALGLAGAAAGAGVLYALETFVAPLAVHLVDGSVQTASALQTLAYIVVAGLVSLIVTFAPAVALKLPEASMITSIMRRVKR